MRGLGLLLLGDITGTERHHFMLTKYLHISAYSCDKCEGPVIAGSFGTRETEISRESALTEVGATCLSCGNKQAEMSIGNVVRQFAPVEWVTRRRGSIFMGLRGKDSEEPT